MCQWLEATKTNAVLRQPNMYISPVVKPLVEYSKDELINSEAIKIIQTIILPRLNQLHALFPEAEKLELRISLAKGACMEISTNPFMPELYLLSPPILSLNLFRKILDRVMEISPRYYSIQAEKPENASYRSFSKKADDDTLLAERILNLKNQDFQKMIEKAHAEKEAKEEQLRINQVLAYNYNCFQALIESYKPVATTG